MSPRLSHPGYIAFKAALASLLALSLVNALGIDDKLSATFVAVVCTTPTVYTGMRRGFGQLAGSALGGTITLTMALWAPRWLTMLVALFSTIWLSFLLGIGRDFAVAAFTVLYVLLIPGQATHTLEHRLASVALGVISATAVNLVVSFLRRRQVFARRLTIARETVAAEWAKTAAALRKGDCASARDSLFEPAFVLLRALQEELTDASRELGGSTRWKEQVQGARTATQQLLAASHFGKDLLYVQEACTDPAPQEAAAAEALANAIAANQPPALPPLDKSLPGARSLQAAAESWTRARNNGDRLL